MDASEAKHDAHSEPKNTEALLRDALTRTQARLDVAFITIDQLRKENEELKKLLPPDLRRRRS